MNWAPRSANSEVGVVVILIGTAEELLGRLSATEYSNSSEAGEERISFQKFYNKISTHFVRK